MLTRRELFTGTLAAGAAPLAAQDPTSDAATHRLLKDILDEVRGLRSCRLSACPELQKIRSAQRAFLRSSGKFPDYIDVGPDVWDRIYDWHVSYGQPIQVTRTPEGRYGLAYLLTTIVLRPDATDEFIGHGYDSGR